ncbi:MAG: glycoside hydrolase family 18 protein [Chitinophagaceae bacterium]
MAIPYMNSCFAGILRRGCRVLLITGLLISAIPLFAQQIPEPKKPTVGQKIVHFLSTLEKKVFKKHDKQQHDTASRAHNAWHTLPNDSSLISPVTQQKAFAVPETTSARIAVNIDGKLAHPSVEIFGYHPSWVGDACKSYISSFITTLAYFSCTLSPSTGKIGMPQQHIDTAVKQSARKTVITITNFGSANNSTFLKSTTAQQQFISNALALIDREHVNGISIDFEEVPLSCSNQYSTFIKALSMALHKKDNTMQLSIALPGLDEEGVFDISELSKYVNYIIVMAYDYYWKSSVIAGPTAPLTSNHPWLEGADVTTSIARYISRGAPLNKLLLGIPYYGLLWQTHTGSIPSAQHSYKAVPYYEAKEMVGSHTPLFDSATMTNYYIYKDSSANFQLWYDGPQSLNAKYQFVVRNHLGGIAIWCLGYDRNNTELWQALVDNFNEAAVDSLQSVAEMDSALTAGDSLKVTKLPPASIDSAVQHLSETVTVPQPEENVLSLIGVTGFKQVLVVGLCLLCTFFFLGFLVAFTNNTLIGFFKEKLALLYLVYALVLIAVILLLLFTAGIKLGWEMFAAGLGAGVIIISLVGQAIRKRKRIP